MSLVYFFKIVELLETNEDLKKSVVGIAKQCAWVSGATIAGGVVGGPVGAFLGGVAGAYVGYFRADDYKSLVRALKDMSDDEKYRLQQKVQELIGSSSLEALIAYVQSEVNHALLLGLIKDGVEGSLKLKQG